MAGNQHAGLVGLSAFEVNNLGFGALLRALISVVFSSSFFAYYRWRHPLPPREFALDGGARMAEGDNGLTQEEIDVIPTFFGIEDEVRCSELLRQISCILSVN